ncbi:MAG: leucyl aminopeptidase [Proteobacteria bacterium]|nr:leucyl aminopeptidase [Pseudomonadota bacterium]
MRFITAIFALFFFTASAAAQTEIEFTDYTEADSGTWIAGVYEGGILFGTSAGLDRATEGALARAVAAEGFTGEEGRVLIVPGPGAGLTRVVLVGMGPKAARTPRQYRDIAGTAIRALGETFVDRAVISLDDRDGTVADAGTAANLALGAKLASYRFDRYHTGLDNGHMPGIARLVILTAQADAARALYASRLEPLAKAIFLARDLISEPANVIYPESFVTRVRRAARGVDVDIDVLKVRDMKKLKMGALLGVGQGSERPPRLLVLRYNGGAEGDAPVVFVGKGITFDSGGISIKPRDNMWRMKYDMSGAASAVGAVLALAGRKAKVNVVGIAALAENMPSAAAQRPGDVVTAMSGRTIEIWNTDAEGRLVLADAVWYAQVRFRPRVMIDLATLTGAVRRALGTQYAGLFTRHDDLASQLLAAGEASGEMLWRLPLHPAQRAAIRSDIADIKNISGNTEAGAGVGAQVIGTFVATDTRWAHLDIAGVAWTVTGGPTTPPGAVGFGIQLLDQLVADYYESE